MKRLSAACMVFIFILLFNTLPVFSETGGGAVQAPAIKSEAAVLMDQKTGKILFEKNSHKKMYPASLTKVLTAILITENLDLDETVTVGKEINRVGKDSSGAGLSAGQKISGRDLIWALMLPSGNDASYTAAVAVARKKSGNDSMEIQEALKYFVGMMNERAQQIGAKESNFTNPDGYPDENHYSTAHDLALIAKAAMGNDFIKEVAGTYTYTIQQSTDSQASSKKKTPDKWVNINQMINPDSKYFYQYATGIKTGNTSAAGYCLASSAVKSDMTLVSIVLKADKEETRWVDSKALLEYGFDSFKYHTLVQKGVSVGTVKVFRKYLGDSVEIKALADQEYTDVFTDQDFKNIKQTITWDPALALPEGDKNSGAGLAGPVKTGQAIGKVTYSLNGNTLFESQLTADRDSKQGNYTDTLYNVLDQAYIHKSVIIPALAAFIALVVILIIWGAIRRKRMRAQ